jgi:small-conductance mechanosensitive channel
MFLKFFVSVVTSLIVIPVASALAVSTSGAMMTLASAPGESEKSDTLVPVPSVVRDIDRVLVEEPQTECVSLDGKCLFSVVENPNELDRTDIINAALRNAGLLYLQRNEKSLAVLVEGNSVILEFTGGLDRQVLMSVLDEDLLLLGLPKSGTKTYFAKRIENSLRNYRSQRQESYRKRLALLVTGSELFALVAVICLNQLATRFGRNSQNRMKRNIWVFLLIGRITLFCVPITVGALYLPELRPFVTVVCTLLSKAGIAFGAGAVPWWSLTKVKKLMLKFPTLDISYLEVRRTQTRTNVFGELIDTAKVVTGVFITLVVLLGPSYFVGVFSVTTVAAWIVFQRPLKNALAGIGYFIKNETFSIGDFIVVDTKTRGYVKNIGLFRFELVDTWNPTKRLSLPNSTLDNVSIEILNEGHQMTYDGVFYSRYEDDVEIVRDIFEKALAKLWLWSEEEDPKVWLSIKGFTGPESELYKVGLKWRVIIVISIEVPSNYIKVVSTFTQLLIAEYKERGIVMPCSTTIEAVIES